MKLTNLKYSNITNSILLKNQVRNSEDVKFK